MAQTLIYHGHCHDGFMAAVIFRKANGTDADKIEFYAGEHQADPPDVTGREVTFVDFSYKRPVILDMAAKAKSILILDHHDSAQTDLINLPTNVKTIFDVDRSGTGLAWDIFMSGQPRPAIVNYIEAQDLRRFAGYAHIHEVVAALLSYDYDFDLWDQFLDTDQDQLIADLARDGQPIIRRHKRDLQALIETGQHELIIAGQTVPAINVPLTMAGHATETLAQGWPFAAAYFFNGRQAVFSLTSDKNGADVSRIADQYGGGGHKHRSGFRIDYVTGDINDALKLDKS